MKTSTRIMSLVGLMLMSCWTQPVAAANYTIQMTSSDRFSPASLSIGVGDTVIWTNTSGFSTHTSTSGAAPSTDGHWRSASVSPGGTFGFTFTNLPPQSYAYFCEFHYDSGMTGTLTITNASITPASLENPVYTNGQFKFTVNGKSGTKYVSEVSQNFTQWVAFQTNVAPSAPFTVSDPSPGNRMSFYRVRVAP